MNLLGVALGRVRDKLRAADAAAGSAEVQVAEAPTASFGGHNPSASYDELASLPGAAVSQCTADEVLSTNLRRCILIVNTSKERVARWAQS